MDGTAVECVPAAFQRPPDSGPHRRTWRHGMSEPATLERPDQASPRDESDPIGSSAHRRKDFWAIVLAGGEGVRLRPLVRRAMGDDRPKQYVKLLGPRTLLRQTLDRVGLGIPAS